MYLEKQKDFILQLGFSESQFPQLKKYIDFLWAKNEDLNLISRKMTYEELIDNHLIDCLLPLKRWPKELKLVADFGSGGGLPGVAYAIQFPKIQFHLYEKSPKKQAFLNECRSFAPNIAIKGEIPKDFSNVDLVFARAFKPIDVLLDMSRVYYQKNGKYFLLKGRNEKIQEELTMAAKKFKPLKAEIIPLKSPLLDVERNLVLIN